MIKNFADRRPITFSFIVTLVIMILFMASMFLFAALFNVDLKSYEATTGFFITSILAKLVFAVAIVFVLLRVEMQLVMRLSTKGLLKGFVLGWLPVALAVLVFLTSFDFSKITIIEQDRWLLLLLYSVEMLLAGLTEEFLCRGFLYNIALNKCKNVRNAVLLSSAIFGVVHLLNLVHQPLIGTLGQVVFAFGGGVLFAAIYERSDNIWVVVLIHAIWNIVLGATGILIPEVSDVTVGTGGVIAEVLEIMPFLVIAALFIGMGLFLIRKKRLIAKT